MSDRVLHHKFRDSLAIVAAGGTPSGQASRGPVPQGYEWEVEVVSYTVIGNAHTAAFDLAIGPDNGTLPAQAAWDHAGLVWTSPAAIRNTENTGPPFWMDAGEFVTAIVSGGTLAAGDVVTVTYQIAVYEKDPVFGLLTPEERHQVAASHESHLVGLTETAVAHRRAV